MKKDSIRNASLCAPKININHIPIHKEYEVDISRTPIHKEYKAAAKSKNMEVLWIDTDLTESALCEKGRMLLDMAGLTKQPENLKVVSLCGYSCADRLDITLQAIEENAPDFVYIDSVDGLCQDIYDQKECQYIVRQLDRYSARYGAAILCQTYAPDDGIRDNIRDFLRMKSPEVYEEKEIPGTNNIELKRIETRFDPKSKNCIHRSSLTTIIANH